MRSRQEAEAALVTCARRIEACALVPHRKMEFHRVEPGFFRMGEADDLVAVMLTAPFKLMSAPVTQLQWTAVMGANRSRFAEGPETVEVEIDGSVLRMQPDHPVEMVSWRGAKRFIEELHQVSAGGVDLGPLIFGHRPGDRYRLPTEAEWEFVASDRGRAGTRFPSGDDENSLQAYAWHSRNSGGQTHPVESKKPFVVDGCWFHDLHGNVHEWVEDWFDDSTPEAPRVDPRGPKSGFSRTVRGGSWREPAWSMTSTSRGGRPPGHRFDDVGFRLARDAR